MAADLPDYYAILQVLPSAQQEVIAAAYRRLARIYHPDVNPSPDANQRMAVLNQAYAVLSDPAARAHYDGLRREPSREGETQQGLNKLYLHVAEQLRAGKSANQVQADLVASGLRDDTALFIVTEVVRALNEARKAQAQKDILWGSVWFFGGAIVTASTYMLASQTGGWYLITWGPVIFGGYQLLKGLSKLYSAVGWKGSRGAVLTLVVITLILGGIGVLTLNEKAPGGTLSGGGGSTPNFPYSPTGPGGGPSTPNYAEPTPNSRPSKSSERSALSVQIDSNKLKLAALERDTDTYDVTLNGLEARMDSIRRRYPSLVAPEPEYSRYNRIVNEYNSTVAKRNALFDDYERLLITTNRLVAQYNSLR